MKNTMGNLYKKEKGFTLVELLIIFALLALLAAVLVPSVASLVGFGGDTAADSEKSIVQTAMDSMMAVNLLGQGDVPQVDVSTQDMTSFPSVDLALYPEYVRYAESTYNYTCDTNGVITQVAP